LGSAAVFVIVTIQNNPLAYTRLDREEVRVVAAALARPPVRIGTTTVESVPRSVAVSLEEVQIVGHIPPPARVVQAEQGEADPEVSVLPAPCNDGEYRLLEEGRGVRLMCNPTP
jgi:hypothetical protein